MSSYKQEAEVLRLLLCYGCTSGAKIITWADETIMAESDIDDNLIELSTESPDKTPALLSRLSDIAVSADKFAALRTALGRMHDIVANDSAEDLAGFAAGLGNVAREYNNQLPDDLSFLKTIKEQFEQANHDGGNAVTVANQAFLQRLKQFKDASAN
jgi:hypothetical protein